MKNSVVNEIKLKRHACFGWLLAVMIVLPAKPGVGQTQSAFKTESFSSQLKFDTRELVKRIADDQVHIFSERYLNRILPPGVGSGKLLA